MNMHFITIMVAGVLLENTPLKKGLRKTTLGSGTAFFSPLLVMLLVAYSLKLNVGFSFSRFKNFISLAVEGFHKRILRLLKHKTHMFLSFSNIL